MKKFNTIYNHATPVSPNGGVSRTDQQYKKECDVNEIIKAYTKSGKLPTTFREGVSGDFSGVGDFSACLAKINKAKDEFAALPSKIRDRFGNDPAAYVDFCLDPANAEEAVRLGLRVINKKEKTSTEILQEIEKNTRKEVTPPKGGAGAA